MSTVNPTSDAWNLAEVPLAPGRISEQEFERWVLATEGVRAEWVKGTVQMMSPAGFEHFDLNGWLYRLLCEFVETKKLGGIVGFDCMVRLDRGQTRRIPDILYVSEARRSLMKPTFFEGPPDLVVEIVSSDSQSRDRREKFIEYEAAGVREYWIADPLSQRIEAYSLGEDGKGEDGKYVRIAEVEGRIPSTVLPSFYLRNDWLWANPRPTMSSLLGELG
jgi:Uma2 family endonuclease